MSNFLWLFDPGHGGVINGIYQTVGKRSPKWEDGSELLEGEFNRSIVARLMERCTAAGIRYVNIVPELEDIPLQERVERANRWHPINSCIYLSVHANAGGGNGFEVWTSRGETRSDQIANIFFERMREEFSELPANFFRADIWDGDFDKEANFYVLRHTRMPAILTENFFMDSSEECHKFLLTRSGRDRIADAHFRAMVYIESLHRQFS